MKEVQWAEGRTRGRAIVKNVGAYLVTTVEEPVYDPPATTAVRSEQVAKVDRVEAVVDLDLVT